MGPRTAWARRGSRWEPLHIPRPTKSHDHPSWGPCCQCGGGQGPCRRWGTGQGRHRRLPVSEEVEGVMRLTLLGGDRLATTTTFVGGNDNLALAVIDSVSERLCAETCKDGRVDCSDPGTCEEGGGRLPCHGKAVCQGRKSERWVGVLDGDCISLLDTPRAKDVRNLASLPEEFCVRDLSCL